MVFGEMVRMLVERLPGKQPERKLGRRSEEALLAISRALPDYAGRVLTEMADPAVIPVLVESLRDSSKRVWQRAIAGLVEIGKPALPLLLGALENENSRMRARAAVALGRMGDLQAVPGLIERLALERGLIARRLEDAEETMEHRKTRKSGFVVLQIVEALGRIGEPTDEIVAALEEALRADMRWIHEPAGTALARVGTAEGLALMEEFGLEGVDGIPWE